MVGPIGALYFVTTHLDMTRYRCFSGVRFSDQGSQRNERLLRYETMKVSQLHNRQFYFFLNDLDPDGPPARRAYASESAW
jgi:hypothetical protein